MTKFIKEIKNNNKYKSYKKFLLNFKGGSHIFIDEDEEVEYIASRYKKVSEDLIRKILNYYYDKQSNGESSNPENYYDKIADKFNINVKTIEEIFDVQLEFLLSKGIATSTK